MTDPWDALKRALSKRRDEKYIKDAEELKEHMPPELRALIDQPGARLIPPSEIEANPMLSQMDTMVRMKLHIEELEQEYRSALQMVRALVITYGVKEGSGNQAFVSNEVLLNCPDCLEVEAKQNKVRNGHDIYAGPHACKSKAHPN